MLPCVWFSNRSQKTSKCGKNISDTLGYASCATYLFLPHFDVICDLLLNRHTATWNLFVKYTTLNHIRFCFLPQYQRNEIFVLTIENTDSDLKVHYANELLVRVRLFQKILQTRLKPHFDLFFTTISTSKKMFFFRARAKKVIAWHIDASSVVETLIYHGKLANQIARLPAIVVKSVFVCSRSLYLVISERKGFSFAV